MGLWDELPTARSRIWLVAAAPWAVALPMVVWHERFAAEPLQVLVSLLLVLPPIILLTYFGASERRSTSRRSAELDRPIGWAWVIGSFLVVPTGLLALVGAWPLARVWSLVAVFWGAVAVTRRDVGHPRRRLPRPTQTGSR